MEIPKILIPLLDAGVKVHLEHKQLDQMSEEDIVFIISRAGLYLFIVSMPDEIFEASSWAIIMWSKVLPRFICVLYYLHTFVLHTQA